MALFVVLRASHWNEAKRTIDRGETHVFVGPRYVVSVRHGDTGSYALVRERCEISPEHLALGPGFVLYAIMDFVVDSYFGVIEHFEDRVGKLEEAIFADRSQRDIARRIYDLKRRMIVVKRAVSPLVEVCNRLVRYDSHQLIPDAVRPYFRDVYDHVVRINESVDVAARAPGQRARRQPGDDLDPPERGHEAARELGRRSSRCRP